MSNWLWPMIHLFNKLYITYAETVVGPDAHERMCDDYIHIVDKGLDFIKNENYAHKRFAYTKSVNELIENYSDEYDMFQKIFERLDSPGTNKLVIYADDKAMTEFLIRWWKGLFPKITVDGLAALYHCYADSEIIQLAKTRNYLNIASDCSKMSYKKLAKLYWRRSKEEIRGLFELYPAFDLPRFARESCSIEFQLIDYMLNSESTYLPLLMKKYGDFYKKAFVNEVCGIKRMIERNLYTLLSKDESFENINLLGNDNIESLIDNHESFKFLRDERIKESKHTFTYIEDRYDLPKLCQDLLKYDALLNGHRSLTMDQAILDNPLIGHYVEHGTHPKLEEMLKDELSGENPRRIFKRMIEKNIYNPYLLKAVAQYREKNGHGEESLIAEYRMS